MSEAFSNGDLTDLRDQLLAEIGRRLKDPKERTRLTSTQLVAAAKELEKLAQATQDNSGEEDLDLFALVERLPATQRRKHLKAERVRLEERLARVNVALG